MSLGADDLDAPRVAQRLKALPDQRMRRAVLGELIRDLGAGKAVRLCSEILRRGPDGSPFDVALIALSQVIENGDLGYELHQELYRAAVERRDAALARALLSAEVPPPGTPQAAPIPGHPELTLGQRKALARTSRRDILDRLLRDPDPTVIEILLGNPRITEADVVRLAARRPTTAAAQRRIHMSRFVQRYVVKRALVFNPYTPSDLAARLLPALTLPDQREVASTERLPEQVRAVARSLVARTPTG